MEDLDASTFFKTLRGSFNSLFAHAAQNVMVICVPPSTMVTTQELERRDFFEMHILQPSPFFKGQFETMNGKMLSLEGRIFETQQGFEENRKSEILGEELFYNKDFKPHRVLSISRPFAGGIAEPATAKDDRFKEHETVEEQLSFLMSICTNQAAIIKADQEIALFNRSYVVVRGFLADTAKKLRSIIVQCVESLVEDNPILSTYSSRNHRQILTRAVQTYVLKAVHERLWGGLEMIFEGGGKGEGQILEQCILRRQGKTIRELDVDERIPTALDLSNAVKSVKNIGDNTVPMPKVAMLKQCFRAIQEAVNEATLGKVTLATDDLLPLFIFVLIEANPRHLFVATEYLKHFYSVDQTGDEWGFYVANLSAAVEFLISQAPTPSSSSSLSKTAHESRPSAAAMALPAVAAAAVSVPKAPSSSSSSSAPSSKSNNNSSNFSSVSKPTTTTTTTSIDWEDRAQVAAAAHVRHDVDRLIPEVITMKVSENNNNNGNDNAATAPLAWGSRLREAELEAERRRSEEEDEDLGDFLTQLRDSDDVVCCSSSSSSRW